MGKFDSLWIEKYRPAILDDLVLSSNNRDIINKFVESKNVPQLLFLGNAGIGKTTLAKIITNTILQCQYLYINASDENGIDTIRSKVTSFSKTKSYDGSIKIIILDEVDGLTLDAQRCLRNTMEEYSEFTRFILTANYKHKVIPAVQSRCQSIDLIPPQDKFIDRCIEILGKEKCSNITDSKDDIVRLCRRYYPDLRKAINELQKSVINNKFINVPTNKQDVFIKNIYSLVQAGKTLKLRKFVIENEVRFNGDYQELLKQLFNHLHNADISDDIKRKHLLVTSEHIYRSSFVADQEINFYSCLLALD